MAETSPATEIRRIAENLMRTADSLSEQALDLKLDAQRIEQAKPERITKPRQESDPGNTSKPENVAPPVANVADVAESTANRADGTFSSPEKPKVHTVKITMTDGTPKDRYVFQPGYEMTEADWQALNAAEEMEESK